MCNASTSQFLFFLVTIVMPGYFGVFFHRVINSCSVTGVWFLQQFDKCVSFRFAAWWQVMITAMNKLVHPHAHCLTIHSTKSGGPGCEQTGREQSFQSHMVVICLFHFLFLMGSFVAVRPNIFLKMLY